LQSPYIFSIEDESGCIFYCLRSARLALGHLSSVTLSSSSCLDIPSHAPAWLVCLFSVYLL